MDFDVTCFRSGGHRPLRRLPRRLRGLCCLEELLGGLGGARGSCADGRRPGGGHRRGPEGHSTMVLRWLLIDFD